MSSLAVAPPHASSPPTTFTSSHNLLLQNMAIARKPIQSLLATISAGKLLLDGVRNDANAYVVI